MAYERLYGPLGPSRGDYQAASIVQALIAVNTDPTKKKKDPPKLTDLVIPWGEASSGDDT